MYWYQYHNNNIEQVNSVLCSYIHQSPSTINSIDIINIQLYAKCCISRQDLILFRTTTTTKTPNNIIFYVGIIIK